MFSKLRTQSEKQSSIPTRKSRNTCDRGSGSDSSSSDYEKHASHRTNWRDTQECYRCHMVGQIALYCQSTTPVQSRSPTETAAATMTTTSIENYWMTVTNSMCPSKES